MSPARFVQGLLGGTLCLTALGCYAHHPWGPYGYGGYAPLYSTPGTIVSPSTTAPGGTFSPGVDSLGQPAPLESGPSDGFQQPVPYDEGTFYDGGSYNGSSSGNGVNSRSSGKVPDYHDLDDPASTSGGPSESFGEYGVTPFGPNRTGQ